MSINLPTDCWVNNIIMQKQGDKKKLRPKQEQNRPGKESKLKPESITTPMQQVNKLLGKVALITGGDSGNCTTLGNRKPREYFI